MKSDVPVGVTSRSFSSHPLLRKELLERYSDVRFNEAGRRLSGTDLVEFATDRQKLIVALEHIDGAFLDAVPGLRVISKYGVGTDSLDKAALMRRQVRLGWRPGVNRRSVAELAIAFMLSLLHLVPQADRELRAGRWASSRGRCLSGREIGIVGCGHVGKELATLLRAFGCRVFAHDILSYAEFYAAHDVTPLSLEELLRRSDVVSLHVPLDASTRGMMGAERLALMRPGSILVNTARGGIVDEDALVEKLRDGVIAGAGFDVFAEEPTVDTRLLSLPNFLATPHIGGSSEEAILAMGRAAIEGLDDNAVPTAAWPPDAA